MGKKSKYIFLITLIVSGLSVFALSGGRGDFAFPLGAPSPDPEPDPQTTNQQAAPKDTTARYPVKKTQMTGYEDLDENYPIDLRDPSNIKTEVEYDSERQLYLFKTKVGDGDWVTTLTMSPEEYNKYLINKSMSSYFKSKYESDREKGDSTGDFSLKDIKISLGPAERIFGPGGVQIKTQGYTEVSMGIKHNSTDDPTKSERNRSQTMFDFDQKIQMNVKASVGDKVNFDLNYDTEASFDFDSKKIKLAYEGKEDEILKRLEAGNVSMATTNSLINGGTALFGIRADLQFGKLKISSVISQQESESKTVNSKSGVQTTPFEFMADQYDENRHFFLGYYFRDNYDEAMSKLPFVNSPVTITNMEVWVTNKRGNFSQARDVVAFADIAEADSIHNKDAWVSNGLPEKYPSNKANTLYESLIRDYYEIRDITKVTSVLGAIPLEGGLDYEKIQGARKLESSEYTYNTQTGYISLRTALQSDEVLGVAYQYRAGGEIYQVGELAGDIGTAYDPAKPNAGGALYLKLLKPVSLSPDSYTWHLMMKNVYSLGAYQLQEDRFRLNIAYLSDTTGTYLNYLPEGKIKDELLIRVMNLDRLNSRKNAHPDGIFDFLEGFTVNSSNGRIIFPVVEPFGSHLAKKLGNDSTLIKRYVYQELYDLTLTEARQVAEKNKYKLSGSYRASNSSEIDLGATNVPPGSVKVVAAGETLVENVDYTVNYSSGIVTLINSKYESSSVSVTLENRTLASAMQRRTMLGLNLSYDFSKDFTIGGTFMHMYEKPLTMKAEVGSESLKNTLWGLNASFRTESQWLTNLVDKLPFYNATAPSSIAFTGEFAHLIPGHYENKYSGGYSYLDDFERSKSKLELRYPYNWFLASTPANKKAGEKALFPEALLTDSIDYNKNRAHLAWFTIDNIFTRENASNTPQHIRNDKEQLSNHFVREIYVNELYPNRDLLYNETATISALNLSYYPTERGMYNVYTGIKIEDQYEKDGTLTNPQKRWGGIMRRMDNKDFEANNIEYIEFWLMDPFVYNNDPSKEEFHNIRGGDLYFNLGEISEDILKDGKKFYENGIPADGDPSAYDVNNWGRFPTRQATVYAFDDTNNGREVQDVGYNGLSSDQEKEHHSYKNYLNALKNYINSDIYNKMMDDPLQLSPVFDPSGDTFHYFRGSDYDREEVSILNRYKRINGTEGNSKKQDENGEDYGTASRSFPDVEDIDGDYNMNETEAYYQYRVSIRPEDMKVGTNYIVDKREVTVPLRNGKNGDITWYQFKIPINNDDKETIGNIKGFKSIRFMRMFLTKFEQPAYLRFGTLDLIRGDWRVYTNPLDEGVAQGDGSIVSTTVNIEENGDRVPVNYVLPPGVTRIIDPSQPQLKQENEQAMSLKVENLAPQTSRAVYKNLTYDLRRYKRIQMFSHVEAVSEANSLEKGELTVFLRLGSDYKNNYYEYEIPLTVTPWGTYSSNNANDQAIVWPSDNMFDFPLELLKDIKLQRNKEKRQAGSNVSFTEPYPANDPDKPNNRITIMGNPSLSEIRVLMIGVRNKTRYIKSGEVWVNELRLTDFDEEGGWAAQGNLNITLSDLATINVSGRKETIGFGGLDQSLTERRNDDLTSYNIAANIDFGKLLPEKAQVTLPFYYTYSNQTNTPKYDPLDQDVTLKESLELVDTKAEKDSIRNLAQDKTITKNISISNARVNIKSKNPMPYDPANFSFSYSHNKTEVSNPTTTYDVMSDYRASLSYNYSPVFKPWEPFKNVKSNKGSTKFIKSLAFGYLPNNITFNTAMTRNYNEVLLRDIESYTLGEPNTGNEFLSWSQSFYWDRDFSLTWDFTKNLKFSFTSGTKAEIYEDNRRANKEVNPDEYEIWKDEVWNSIKGLGTPLSYKQNAKLTYTLPFAAIPILDWINSNASYDVDYTWDRGADMEMDIELGNNIMNRSNFTTSNRFNLLNLYNKWGFLKKVNQKFDSGSSSSSRRSSSTTGSTRRATPKPEKKKFEQEIVLLPDTTMTIKHNLNSKNVRVTARREDGRTYSIKYKKGDSNSIKILPVKDTANIKLTVIQGPDPEEGFWYKAAQYTTRGLMSVRSISVNYSRQEENYIYGFKPMIGDVFGQKKGDLGMTPGLGFAFGFKGGEEYINELNEKKQLVSDTLSNISPAIFNVNTRLDIRATLEPIKGLKIDLTALREERKSTELQFMYTGMPRNYGGSFSMTTIALATAFKSSNSKDNYSSDVFNKFLEYRGVIANRLEGQYNSGEVGYPYGGFMGKDGNTGLQGEKYNPDNGSVNRNSSDVLIPAFLAAYTGKSADNIKLSAFPSLSALLPNWSVTYDGLLDLFPSLKSKFKAFKLNHAYTCQYRVGSYSSYSDWLGAIGGNGDLGFTQSTLNSSPLPSSPYIIPSVSLTEAFNPLFGMEGTLVNNMTLRTRYNTSRNINLNTSSYQIVETSQGELVIGMGYKITNFNRVLGIKDKTIRGFSNDLNVMADVSHRKSQSLIRKIEEGYTQATSGTSIFTIKISADYSLSRALTLKAFFDRIVNTPLISASSYPTTNTNFGISLRFTLTQ